MNCFLVRNGEAGPVVQFEQNEFIAMTVTCTWPRSTQWLEPHDPGTECGWTYPEWNQVAMTAHAQQHLAPTDCPFCGRIQRGEYDDLFGAVARFEPLNPVTPGHLLFVPSIHVEHPNRGAVGNAMNHAELYASGQPWDFNLITSSGSAATQTVPHIHVHYVPRREGDGLHLPWTGQKKAA